MQRARRVFEEALNYFKSSAPDLREEKGNAIGEMAQLGGFIWRAR